MSFYTSTDIRKYADGVHYHIHNGNLYEMTGRYYINRMCVTNLETKLQTFTSYDGSLHRDAITGFIVCSESERDGLLYYDIQDARGTKFLLFTTSDGAGMVACERFLDGSLVIVTVRDVIPDRQITIKVFKPDDMGQYSRSPSHTIFKMWYPGESPVIKVNSVKDVSVYVTPQFRIIKQVHHGVEHDIAEEEPTKIYFFNELDILCTIDLST